MTRRPGRILASTLSLFLALAILTSTAKNAKAQFFGYGGYGMGMPYGGYGMGYGGYGMGYGGLGMGYGMGYGGLGMGYGGMGYGGMGYGGMGYGGMGMGYGGMGMGYGGMGYGGFGGGLGFGVGYPNLGYAGLASAGFFGPNPYLYPYTGIIDPLFGLGLSPLGVQSGVVDTAIRRGAGPSTTTQYRVVPRNGPLEFGSYRPR